MVDTLFFYRLLLFIYDIIYNWDVMKVKSKMSFLSIIILMTMCSCGDIKGSWVDIDATQSNIKTTVNTTVAPFNTVMSLKYFINEMIAKT